MRKKLLSAMATGLFLAGMFGVASATSIKIGGNYTEANKASSYKDQTGFLTETFDSASLGIIENSTGLAHGWLWTSGTDSGSVVKGSVSGQHAAPFGQNQADATNYLSVPNPDSTGSVKVKFKATYNYFGLWWGSIDKYNSLDFYNGGTNVFSFSGAKLIPASGSWTAQSQNSYVNFLNLDAFDSVVFTSTQKAFELDNITVGNNPVPEPATILLFGTGLAGLVGARRRSKKN